MTDDHEHRHGDHSGEAEMFEPDSWDERYAGDGRTWSGRPNAQLVTEVADLPPGTALDVGCGEGGDVVWLAAQGWRVTGADFSEAGLARAARHAEEAGVADLTDWWQVDARSFDADGRAFDLVSSFFLHPPDGGMPDVTARLATAVAPRGHLLVVGHAPHETFLAKGPAHRRARFVADDLRDALPADFEVLVCEQRPRRMERDGEVLDVHDSTLHARRGR